jgi:hypothetical protein
MYPSLQEPLEIALGLAKKIRRRLKTSARGWSYPAGTVHFLHVGKAAGTQVKGVIHQLNEAGKVGKLIKHGHEVTLADLPEDQAYFFSTRDPATRFKSGFYSRLRKGQPRLLIEWTEHERLAFERFPHANDLAEALFAPGRDGREAAAAIRSIRHTARNLVDWFRFSGHLFDVRPPVWIVRQEHFAADLEVFLARIGHEGGVDLATDERRSHTNDYAGVPALIDAALANLRRWYAQDYAFLELCEDWMAAQDEPGRRAG